MVLCCYALLNERSGICVHRNLAWISHWAGLWGNYWNTTHETDVMIITSSDISCDIVVTCQKVSYTNLVYMMYLQLSFIMAVFSRFVLLEIPYNPWNIRRYLCNAHCLSIITQLTYTVQLWVTVYLKKYAHGSCFVMFCCGYTLTDLSIYTSTRLTLLVLWQSNDCPSASKATLLNTRKFLKWIHHERLHNHNKQSTKPCASFLGYTVLACTTVAIE